FARPSPQVPSLNSRSGTTAKGKPKVYSGERRLLGVATMHKSNMVPVFADKPEEATEIARMRRDGLRGRAKHPSPRIPAASAASRWAPGSSAIASITGIRIDRLG